MKLRDLRPRRAWVQGPGQTRGVLSDLEGLRRMVKRKKTSGGIEVVGSRARLFLSLSSKLSGLTAVLLLWVVPVVLLWDVSTHAFIPLNAIALCPVIGVVAGAISRFTIG